MSEHDGMPEIFYIHLDTQASMDPELNALVQSLINAVMDYEAELVCSGPSLDAQMQGEDIPEILDMIMSAQA